VAACLLSDRLRCICPDEGHAGSTRAGAAEASSVHTCRFLQQLLQRGQLHTANLPRRDCVSTLPMAHITTTITIPCEVDCCNAHLVVLQRRQARLVHERAECSEISGTPQVNTLQNAPTLAEEVLCSPGMHGSIGITCSTQRL